MYRKFIAFAFSLALLAGAASLNAQGALSNQVLQLLTRINSWTTTNTFADLRVANAAIPSVTTYRIYADTSGNLYFNGGLIAGAGGGVTPHNLLSVTHADTVAASPVRGDIIVANSTPAWTKLSKCTTGYFIGASATDTVCSNDATAFINIPGANITGTIAAVSGVNLTNLNASNLASGTVPLARISGLTNSQLSGSAGITYANLTLGGNIVNADINAAAAIAYSKLNLSTSVQNSDLANTTITFAKWASNACVNTQVPQYNGSAWVCKSLTTSDITGAGTVTSVALSMPAIFTVTGSPITTTGTLSVTAANQSANQVFAGPTSGGAAAPAFRSLVNADFPTSGATAGSYPYVTVNAQGIVTAGSSAIALGTVTASTPLQVTQTWNNAGVAFTGILENITNTASAAASLLADFQLGGVSKFKFDKNGSVTAAGGFGSLGTAPSTTVGLNVGLIASSQALVTTQASGEVSGVNFVSLAATWNNAANTPTAIDLNITDTASNAASLLLNLRKGGTSQFKVDKSGNVTAVGNLVAVAGTFSGLLSANLGLTVPTGQTATVTDTDKLTIGGNKIANTLTFTCYGINANSLSGDCMFIADRAYQVTGIKVEQKTAGGAGCVADIEKLTGTTAPGSGTVMGTGSYDCNGTANNTVTTYTLTGTTATLQLAAGDRMGIKLGGTLTALAGLTATVQMKAI